MQKQNAWNMVRINGKWKFIDTTWDDADNGKKNKTTDEFRKYVAAKVSDMTNPIIVKVLNKNVDTSLTFLFHYRDIERYSIKYDPKQGVNTLKLTRW